MSSLVYDTLRTQPMKESNFLIPDKHQADIKKIQVAHSISQVVVELR